MYVLICNRPTYLQIASRFFITFFLKKTSAHISWISKLKSSLFSDTFDFRKLRIMDVEFFIKKKYKKMDAFFGLGGATGNGCPFFLIFFFMKNSRPIFHDFRYSNHHSRTLTISGNDEIWESCGQCSVCHSIVVFIIIMETRAQSLQLQIVAILLCHTIVFDIKLTMRWQTPSCDNESRLCVGFRQWGIGSYWDSKIVDWTHSSSISRQCIFLQSF